MKTRILANIAVSTALCLFAGDSSRSPQYHRQNYLNAIAKNTGINVVYLHGEKPVYVGPFRALMDTVAEIDEGGVRDVRVRVYRPAFEFLRSECDFRSYLEDHEFYHVDVLKNGLDLPDIPVAARNELHSILNIRDAKTRTLRYGFLEIDAIDNQMRQKRFVECVSREARENLEARRDFFYNLFMANGKTIPNLASYVEKGYGSNYLR